MYAARPEVLTLTAKGALDDAYFTQTLLPDYYIEEHADECASWDIVRDARSNFTEPHTGTILEKQTLHLIEQRLAHDAFEQLRSDFAEQARATTLPAKADLAKHPQNCWDDSLAAIVATLFVGSARGRIPWQQAARRSWYCDL